MPERRWRSAALSTLGLLSAFVLAYVAFVHFQAWSRRMSPDVRDFDEALGASGHLPAGYEVRTQGSLEPALDHGTLTIRGAAHAGDGLVIAAPARRFDDSSLTLRFRAPESGEGLETFIGLEQPTTNRTLAAAFVGGDQPFVVTGGDLSGPMRNVTGHTRTPVPAAAGEWHTLTLQFTPAFSMVSVMFDGRPVASMPAQWFQGTTARIVFGVHGRADVPHVATELGSLQLQTLDWAIPPSFDDHFNGAIVDTHRWLYNEPDPRVATFSAKTEPGRGLALEASVHGFTADPAFAFMLRTAPFALRAVHVHLDLTVDELTDATLFVGLMGVGEWIPPGRVFDTGITKRKDDCFRFVAGAWTNDGKLTFDHGDGSSIPRDLSVDFDYDVQRLVGRLKVGDDPVVERALDLKPLDPVTFRIGALGHAQGGKVRAHVHRITLDVR